MGASSSSHQVSQEEKEAETLAMATGCLPMLQKAFTKLSNPQTNTIPIKTLRECFYIQSTKLESEESAIPESFPKLLENLGASVIDQFFKTENEEISSFEFLRGFVRCCGRNPASVSLNMLCKLYSKTCAKVDMLPKPEILFDDSIDGKVSGSLTTADMHMLLWMCWIMAHSPWILRFCDEQNGKAALVLPEINHLVFSVMVSCSEIGSDMDILGKDVSVCTDQISIGKFHLWALATVPGLANCLGRYVHDRLQRLSSIHEESNKCEQDVSEPSSRSVGDLSSANTRNRHLLTCGRAWAISLSLRDFSIEELLKTCCFPERGVGTCQQLLYRSCLDGKGMNRFWAKVEGYHGPLLMLISASSGSQSHHGVGQWIIGVLIYQGFENKDVYYGIYEAHPKPVGIAFGESIGNERVVLDEDFSRITVRHHAGDKTYKPGSLIANQGFLSVEASILEVEVWGLGGKVAREVQDSYKQREQLFAEQRRKVDLKNFTSWEDLPEKIMMDMISDPNRVRREDR
ncbi:hypothetical protein AMTR_s00185p00029250 [Amborella trichopoda]|uniref:TLDc domain-containing protein n=1 Tax=Amborella trichopoda TaxID=13333 RepID=U5CZ82_AMBTC|nr:hypothetical protein AMTR_s00185p00029250 [Amborella trichopoda]